MTSTVQIDASNEAARALRQERNVTKIEEVLELRRSHPVRGFVDLRPTFSAPITMFCNNDELTALQLYWNTNFEVEPTSLRLWRHLAETARRVCDIGAHCGIYAMVAAQANRQAQIHAFEAVDYIHARLWVNVLANGFGNIESQHLGISSKDGWTEINVRFGPGVLSSGSSIEDRGVKSQSTRKWIETRKLDNLFDGAPVDLMKIDVEGHEFAVFSGADRILREDRPVMLCELLQQSDDVDDSVRLLHTHRYDCFSIQEDGRSVHEVPFGDGLRGSGPNYVFIPRERRTAVLEQISAVVRVLEPA